MPCQSKRTSLCEAPRGRANKRGTAPVDNALSGAFDRPVSTGDWISAGPSYDERRVIGAVLGLPCDPVVNLRKMPRVF